MKAITLWQPWAQLIFVILTIFGKQRPVKRVETRSWNTNFRGRIAIHAAKHKKIDPETSHEIRSAIMAVPEIFEGGQDTIRESAKNDAMTQLFYLERGLPHSRFGAIIGTVEIVDCVPIERLYGTEYDTPLERAVGDWSPGRYGWILKDPVIFETPIPAKGSQGFWNWDKEDKSHE